MTFVQWSASSRVRLLGRPHGDLRRQLATRADPALEPAVEDGLAPAMAQVVEHPPQPGGDPAADVVVGDDEIVRADPRGRQAAGEVGRDRQRVAARPPGTGRERKVAVEVEEDRTGQVAGLVGAASGPDLAEDPADVDDPDVRIVDPGDELLRRDERRADHTTEYARRPCYPLRRRGAGPAPPSDRLRRSLAPA